MELHISLAAEHLWDWGFLPITNALLTTWVVMGLLLWFAFAATRNMKMIPSGAQLIAEIVVGGLRDFFESIAGSVTKQFFSLVATIFLFVLTANWIGLLPGVGTVGFHDHGAFIPLLRSPSADLNMTIALALIAVVAIQFYGFKNLGPSYAKKFLTLKDPISFSVGLLEMISDLSKVFSFGFRLFGNIFAGEVLLAVMAFLMPFILPIPFLALEIFVGIIQALVFSMLTTAFISVAVSHGEEVSAHG